VADEKGPVDASVIKVVVVKVEDTAVGDWREYALVWVCVGAGPLEVALWEEASRRLHLALPIAPRLARRRLRPGELNDACIPCHAKRRSCAKL
jgi:hypothetical protein